MKSIKAFSHTAELVKKQNYIKEHFPNLLNVEAETLLFMELIEGFPHNKLLKGWREIIHTFFRKRIKSPKVKLDNLFKSFRWPSKKDYPSNLPSVLRRILRNKSLLLVDNQSLKKKYNKSVISIYGEILKKPFKDSKARDLGSSNKLDGESKLFLTRGYIHCDLFTNMRPKRNSIIKQFGKSLFNLLGIKKNEKRIVFKHDNIEIRDLMDVENYIFDVEYCQFLFNKAEENINQVFLYSEILPLKLFIQRFCHVMENPDELTLDLMLVHLQLGGFFKWKTIKNKLFIFKESWKYNDMELDQQLSILSIMIQIKWVQDFSRNLRTQVKKIINEEKRASENKGYTWRAKHIETKKKNYADMIKQLNSRFRDLSQQCKYYDKLTSKLYNKNNSNLWMSSIKASNQSKGNSRNPNKIIKKFSLERESPKNKKEMDAFETNTFFLKYNTIINAYFGKVETEYCYNDNFNLTIFKKLVFWLKKVVQLFLLIKGHRLRPGKFSITRSWNLRAHNAD